MTFKKSFEKYIEWKLYKILYLGILVPLLIDEARKWIFLDLFVSLVFFATSIILLLPLIFKVSNIVKLIIKYFE